MCVHKYVCVCMYAHSMSAGFGYPPLWCTYSTLLGSESTNNATAFAEEQQ